MQQNIRQQLHDGRSQLLKGAYFEMLRDQAKVENFLADKSLRTMRGDAKGTTTSQLAYIEATLKPPPRRIRIIAVFDNSAEDRIVNLNL